MLELTFGRLVESWMGVFFGDRKETYSYIFSYLCLDYYRDGSNFSYS